MKNLTEQEIRTRYITPAIQKAGWGDSQIREEYQLTKGRIVFVGSHHKRDKRSRRIADYILFYKPNIPLAVVEAKDNTHSIQAGMQQAIDYASMLDIPFIFSSNGDGFIFRDLTADENRGEKIEREISLDEFPSPEVLFEKYLLYKQIIPAKKPIITEDYYRSEEGKSPRYYQLTAINKTLEAIAQGKKRLLLVMATGTGKTFTAFQIIWRLWRSGVKKRILFLADRNILVDQTMTNDFRPFNSGDEKIMTKITNRKADPSYQVYLALYQAVSGNHEFSNIYKEFSKDFFDLIIIDECHRGSAKEESKWRDILEYFDSATQIGLTATPKETKDVSNIDYFGDPIYNYSLRQGINDGFLAPYRVIRVDLDRDLQGWRPDKGMTDKYGIEIEDRIYNQKDFDRNLILDQRTEIVAKKVIEYLNNTYRYDKTIIFCENIDHAARMRQALINEAQEESRKDARYIMQITGDNAEGKAELDNFIHPESRYPVIVTTSKLMTTGVDAQTCKLIVLDQTINSMTEFKQIIGRGTRINEEFNKFSFTIMDFKGATRLFSDPDFDGEPIQIYEPKGDEPITPPDDELINSPNPDDFSSDEIDSPIIDDLGDPDFPYDDEKEKRYIYHVNNVEVKVLAERVQYFDADGKQITESLTDYTKKTILGEYKTLDEFLKYWHSDGRKTAIIDALEEQGLLLKPLQDVVGRNLDPFDLICHIVWDQPPLTRKERANNVRKKNYFTQYGEKAKKVLDALLDKYAENGIREIEDQRILNLAPFNEMGTMMELAESFGGSQQYHAAIKQLSQSLYQ